MKKVNDLKRFGKISFLLPYTYSGLTIFLIIAVNLLVTLPLVAQLQEADYDFNPPKFGPYQELASGEKFFIRTYLVYLESTDPWATNLDPAELEKRTARTYEVLNAAFNQFDIYFIGAKNASGQCYTISNSTVNQNFVDGLTINVTKDDEIAGGTVGGNSLPLNFCEVGGSENGIPASNLSVVVHEVGHCLGLDHTHEDDRGDYCANGICVGDPLNDPDYCCGDFVEDTQPHNFDDIVLAADCSNTPPGVTPNIYRNFMSYVRPVVCRDQFTTEQGLRMRQYLADTDIAVLQNILITAEVIPTNTSVTWNTAQTKSANIEVESGATLTVDATLSMMPGTYIIVKRGGRLIVNSTVTAACSGMWGGIIVEGNSEAPQKEANGQYSTSQGRLTLNSSGTIEHAIWGVGVHSFDAINDIDDDDYGGGIVELKGKIRNCTRSVRFLRYRDGTVENPKSNVSYISTAQVTLTDDYRGVNQPKPVMVYMREINGLSIAGAWFYDLRTQGCVSRDSRADGLVADDAGFGVNLSNFRNLDHGIIASPSDAGGNGTYTVRNSYFRTCFTGIYSALSDVFTIKSNNFQVDRPSACPVEASGGRLRGIYLPGYDLALGISIADNNFSSINDPQADEFYFGIECINTGQAENFISKNTFDNLDYANRAAGNNGGATGLRYECNEFDGNDFADFYVPASGSVRTIQGDLDAQGLTSTAAGNKFIAASSFTWQNDNAQQTITYYYHNTDPQQNPVTQGAVNGIIAVPATQPNPSCGTGTGGEGPFPLDEQTLSNLKSTFFQQKSDWLTKRAILPTLTGTAAQNLQKEIDAHRSAMDIAGGKVLRNYSLDSTGVKVDSVLLWTKHLQRYESDMRLARHYFFKKDFSTYDNWLTQIPTRNATTAVQSDELTDFTQMMAVMRPGLQAGVSLYGLSTAVLDSLELWASDCTEPGFIAKEILRRNSRKAISECDSELEERQSSKALKSFTSDKIRLYPNPAGSHVYMEIPEQDLPVSIEITGLDGRILLQKAMIASGQVDVSNLPIGFYLCRFTTRSDTHSNHKLIISR